MLLVVLSCLLCISVSFPVPIDRTKLSVHHTIFDEYHTSDGFIHSVFIDRNSNYINWGKVNWDSHTTEDETTKNETIWEEMKSLKRSRGLGGLGFLRKVFLPVGYPNSVPPEYLRYQCWNLIQDSCSYLRGIMSTQAILEGMGVGRSDITALQATIQWILRDGASMLGGLVFTTLSSYNFGQNVKLWRLFADTINNVGITLDMFAPIFRQHFLAIVCVASICKALCGVAAGATGAAISQHLGEKHGNIADVMTRNNAQHTLVSLLGLSISVKFAQLANSSQRTMWTVYFVLTGMHMFSNYKAMRVLALRTINISRYDILVERLLSSPVLQQYYMNNNDNDSDSESESDKNNCNNYDSDNNGHSPPTVSKSSVEDTNAVMAAHEMKTWLQAHHDMFTPAAVAKVEPIISQLIPKVLRTKFRRWKQLMQWRRNRQVPYEDIREGDHNTPSASSPSPSNTDQSLFVTAPSVPVRNLSVSAINTTITNANTVTTTVDPPQRGSISRPQDLLREHHQNRATLAMRPRKRCPTRYWVPPSTIVAEFTGREIHQALEIFHASQYFIIHRPESFFTGDSTTYYTNTSIGSDDVYTSIPGGNNGWSELESSKAAVPLSRKGLNVCFKRGASHADQAQAILETTIAEGLCLRLARRVSMDIFPLFWEFLEAQGWKTDVAQLRPESALIYDFASFSS